MNKKSLRLGRGFHVVIGNRRLQAAQLVIDPGDSEGGPKNRHRRADQGLFVVSGSGEAIINGKRHPLRPHSLLLIQHGEQHEIKNTGEGRLGP